jgi:hypothetical protein
MSDGFELLPLLHEQPEPSRTWDQQAYAAACVTAAILTVFFLADVTGVWPL